MVALTRGEEVFVNESFKSSVLSFYVRTFRDQLSLEMFGRKSDRSCFIFLERDDFR